MKRLILTTEQLKHVYQLTKFKMNKIKIIINSIENVIIKLFSLDNLKRIIYILIIILILMIITNNFTLNIDLTYLGDGTTIKYRGY